MDTARCNVIYVDRNIREDGQLCQLLGARELPVGSASDLPGTVQDDLKLLLDAFGDVHVCASGSACVTKLFNLHDAAMVDLSPTLVLIDTPHNARMPEHRPRPRSPSPHSEHALEDGALESEAEACDELYGLHLLQRIVTEIHLRNLSKLVVPIAVVSFHERLDSRFKDASREAADQVMGLGSPPRGPSATLTTDRRLLRRCLDMGSVDVILSPLNIKSITSLEVHAYRAHKDAAKERAAILELKRGRKRSWVGVNEEKPYAYLREEMVSGLMNGICRLGSNASDRLEGVTVSVSSEQRSKIAAAIGIWEFCAHDLSDDELVVAALLMFKHVLAMPELEKWRIPTDQLTTFLLACRAAYNGFVPYHNFRHVVDVLQATFNFLTQIGTIPPFPAEMKPNTRSREPAPLETLLRPYDALTLLITAIGHDVGHPGVNNGFLVTLNAPLAQLYNDRSVLESFHCAAYSQILRRYWPTVFQDRAMRNLMISSILATDMGLHFDYMRKLGDVKKRLEEGETIDQWTGSVLQEQEALVCSLLIKCADISNVARKHATALKWMHILAEEFSRQALMESELDIPSALIAEPKTDITSLAKAQLGFMGVFAIPLFRGVAEVVPAMRYCVEELDRNRTLFESKVIGERSTGESPGAPSRHSPIVSSRPTSDKGSLPPPNSTRQSPERPAETGDPYEEFSPPPAHPLNKPSHVPAILDEYKEVNGMVTSFDSVADFAASDPFSVHTASRGPPKTQRTSDTTEGSSSTPYTGDWASQATSATTGRMPLSPSTQGTSIISRDSLEQPSSIPVTTITAPDTAQNKLSSTMDSHTADGDANGMSVTAPRALKKRPSRFRMNAFPFFRRHKTPSPTVSASDTTG